MNCSSTTSTAGNAAGFPGRLPPHPAAFDWIHGLLARADLGGLRGPRDGCVSPDFRRIAALVSWMWVAEG